MKTKYIISTLLLLFSVVITKAQVPITPYTGGQFLGKFDFTMIGNTMNEFPNGANSYCDFLTQTSATLNLTAGQTVEAAFLYWAGSGSLTNGDLDIKLNGVTVNVDRSFQNDLATRPIYGAFSDVTALVQATGNGVYTVSDFDLSSVIPAYCSNGTNFGGWSLLIVYHDPILPDNLVKIYDGFERVDSNHQYIEIDLIHPDVLNIVGNKIGFLAFEGDSNVPGIEELLINDGVVSNPPLNPATNVFNGTNSFTNSNTLYNMDIDFFDISDFTTVGDNSLNIKLRSSQDAVIINNIVIVLNSQVPDATIEFQLTTGPCDVRDIEVDYTVHNTIATDVLPANIPIAFYADGILVGTASTVNQIAMGGVENGSITLTIPTTIPNNFTLVAKVDDDGNGNGTVIEFDENNNTHQQLILLGTTPVLFPVDNLSVCDLNDDGEEIFDLTVPGLQILGVQPGVIIRYYELENDAINGANTNIAVPNNYTNLSDLQTIYVRLEDPAGCFIISNFTIQVNSASLFSHSISDIVNCVDAPVTGISVDLTTRETSILNGDNPTDYFISYHLSENDAKQGNGAIVDPNAYPNISNPQTIWVRKVKVTDNCVEYGSFDIVFNLNPIIQTTTLEVCSLDGVGTFFLPDANSEIIANTTGLQFTYHETIGDANSGDNPLPDNYTPASESEIVYVRVVNEFGCHSVINVGLETIINKAVLTNIYSVCNDPSQINDEKAQFDLTTYQNSIANALTIPGAVITYYLTEDEAIAGLNPITDPTVYENISSPQTIYARAANPNGGCGGVAEFEIEVLSVPEFEIPPYIAFCENDEPIYQFEENFVTYTWRDADGNVVGNSAIVEFQNEGMHTLEVTSNVNTCPAIREVEVIFDHSATIMDIKVDGNTVSVFPTGGEAPYQYSYNNGLTWHDYFILDNVPSGVYSMLVKTKYGCISESKLFGVLGIPNMITPNGDGYNDYWEIRALEMYPDATIKIFDRYGKIFMDRKMETNFRWDGKYLGNPLPSGSYWYIITIEEGKSLSGHITIRNR